MTKRSRTIIFLVCFFLFILIAPSAVLYSQGYRFDLENKKFTQTGGLFLKVVPRQVDVYIDGKLNKRTDFFFGSALVENLLPKKYKIEVKKEKYHSWEKTLEIKEKGVTEVKNIVLFPQDVNFNVLSSPVEQFWFSPDQRKIILLEEDKSSSPPSSSKQDSVKEKEKLSWALKLYDLDKNIKSYLISGEDFFTKEPQLINLDFSEDSKKIYLEVSTGEEIKYFILEGFDRAKPLLTERESPSPLVENVVVYQQVGNALYYLDNSGHLFKNGERITATPFPIKQETEYALEIFQGFIFLREDNNLYKFNPDLKVFENFFERINSLKVSPDNKKLAYFSDYEIWILFLSDKNEPPQERTGEKLFLIRLSERITDVFWINDNYLTFIAGDKIKISEIDDRDRLNIIDVFETKKLSQNESPVEMFWNQFDKKLYLLNGEILHRSGALLP
ncbi:MAG: hypothetical protein Q8M00_02440 [bacterium]|nr:hypothetical protein [bacterium]